MEIAGADSAYLDNFRLAASSAVERSYGSRGAGASGFEEILKRAAAGQKSAETDSASFIKAETVSAKQPIDKTDKLYGLCLELETFLIKNLLTGMRNTVQKSGLVDDSYAGKMYEDMLYDEYAKDFTANANFGLAEQAYRQLKRLN